MTIHDLRKLIHVADYRREEEGAVFHYMFNNVPKTVTCSTDTLYEELLAIGSIEYREEFDTYALSQWDALTMVIRHELYLATLADSVLLDIKTICDNLLKTMR